MNYFFLLSPLILQKAIWHATRAVLLFFYGFKIKGLKNVATLKRGVIFAANHSSELDPILVPAALPFSSQHLPIFYVSRPRSFYKKSGWKQIFYGGLLFKLWGSHPAISGFRNYEKSVAAHIRILEKRKSVLIFPEGGKTLDGNMKKEAHGGVAYLSYRTVSPVVPVRIFGDFNMSLFDFLFRRRRITIIFGEPISNDELFPHGASAHQWCAAAQKVLHRIAELKE